MLRERLESSGLVIAFELDGTHGEDTAVRLKSLVRRHRPDGVVVASPSSWHHAHAAAALEEGCGVLVEKPMSLSAAQALRLCRLAREEGVPLLVGHTTLHSPAVRWLRRVAGSGLLGTVVGARCVRAGPARRYPDTGVVMDLAVHDFANLVFVSGGVPLAVRAAVTPPGDGDGDRALVDVRLGAGVDALVYASRLGKSWVRHTTIRFERVAVTLDEIGSPALAFHEPVARDSALLRSLFAVVGKPPSSFGDPLGEEIRLFGRLLSGHEDSLRVCEQFLPPAWQAVRCAEAAVTAARSGQVEFLTDERLDPTGDPEGSVPARLGSPLHGTDG
ncbi:MAG: hypothetical protein KatS3mg008_0542 [Acidimicrobiales bacterium]|nr:MAG: hypothetical protein KatS3mg008_0542 [Acidimicrobiales bacterium]